MRPLFGVFAFVVGLGAGGIAPAWAQVGDPPHPDSIWAAYHQFDYAAAQELAQQAIQAFEQYDPEALADVYVVLALIASAEERTTDARSAFTRALELYPDLQLDAIQVSPKILDLFEEIRARLGQVNREDDAGAGATPRYVRVPDNRAEAALRSMVLPGWGQLYKGERTKGRLLVAVWGVTAAGGITTHVLRQQARSTYLDAATPDEAEDRYPVFNRWHKARNVLFLGAVGVWLYGYLDALVSAQPPAPNPLLVMPSFSERQFYVSLRVRF